MTKFETYSPPVDGLMVVLSQASGARQFMLRRKDLTSGRTASVPSPSQGKYCCGKSRWSMRPADVALMQVVRQTMVPIGVIKHKSMPARCSSSGPSLLAGTGCRSTNVLLPATPKTPVTALNCARIATSAGCTGVGFSRTQTDHYIENISPR